MFATVPRNDENVPRKESIESRISCIDSCKNIIAY